MKTVSRWLGALLVYLLLAPNPLLAQTNIALNKPATASTSQSGFPAKDAFDGNRTGTRWGSEYDMAITAIPRDSNYVYVDLQGTATLTKISLYWESAYATDFKLEISDDKTTWKGLARIANNTSKTNTITVSGTGRYVRMHGLKRALAAYGYSLWEFEVYGTLATPLPVTLTSFSAAPQGRGVALTWATASEQHNAGFEVQRAANGVDFTTLATVAGMGTTQSTHAYGYFDAAPLANTAYYRLRQLDTDGTATYSSVVAVASPAPHSLAVNIYPNPTADRATVTWEVPSIAVSRWYLTNSLGQVVHTEILAGEAATTLSLDLQPYPAGNYVLTVEAGSQVVHRGRVQKAN